MCYIFVSSSSLSILFDTLLCVFSPNNSSTSSFISLLCPCDSSITSSFIYVSLLCTVLMLAQFKHLHPSPKFEKINSDYTILINIDKPPNINYNING